MNNKIKLIVTDDASEFTQENLNILQSKNISVIFCAKDGEELCDKIKRESPDVVPVSYTHLTLPTNSRV